MSCYNNDCNQQAQDPCGQYDNCGCVNPTTFNCTTYTGPDLEIVAQKDDNGNIALQNIDNKLVQLEESTGKVKIDDNDNCPEFLSEKLEAGLNVSFQVVGTGCDRKIRINSTTGGVVPDVNVKVSANDTTSGFLADKLTNGPAITKNVTSAGSNEKLHLDVNPNALLSTDAGNQLAIGTDGKIKTSFSAPDGSETKVIAGSAITVSGTGTNNDPYVISTNQSVSPIKACYNGVWQSMPNPTFTNANVTFLANSNTVKYKIAHDGAIHFKGSMTFTVAFGAYTTANRKFTVNIGSIPTTCLTLQEQAGTADLKGIMYIDTPITNTTEISQYGYIIRKSSKDIFIEFQSAYAIALPPNSPKTIVVNFDGAVSHPNI